MKRNINILIFLILLNRTFIIFKYKDIYKMKKIILFNFICMSFVFYYFEIIILNNLFIF